MIAFADASTASAGRPLKIRMRPDLEARQHSYQGQRTWVIKDPVGLKYFRFREEEYAMLRLLDGRCSLEQIKAHVEEAFPPRTITLREISAFVGSLHQSGLVIAKLPGQGQALKQRFDQERRREWIGCLSNILAIRWRGIDPERLLSGLLPLTRWLFTPAAVVGCLLLGLAALALLAVQWSVFQARLPAFNEFFAAGNWGYLAAALAVTKVLHELGHGLCCRRFGAQCHEMGVMMLVFTPCLYCDVSDSWMLKSKWQRAAIGAAGMYVELILAALATFVWWNSTPGLLNNLALSVMFICSVSTVAFNANPLLKYDGYYILADLLEIPNLRDKSAAFVTRKLGAWCLGLPEREDRYLPRSHRLLFGLYSIAAVVNRWVLVVFILWFLNRVLAPYGLQVVGQSLGLLALIGLVGQPFWALTRYFRVPGRIQEICLPRAAVTCGAVALAGTFAFTVPLPHRVYAPFEVGLHQAAQVFVEVPGVVKQVHAQPGDRVEVGAILVELENLDVQLEAARLRGQVENLRARLMALRRQRFAGDSGAREADTQMTQLEQAVLGAEAQLKERELELSQLTVRSPSSGTIMAAAPQVGGAADTDTLPSWSGTPLDARNAGTWLAQGVSVCHVGEPGKLEGVLMVDQADIPWLRVGQAVQLALEESAGQTVTGQIVEIAETDTPTVSPRLSNKHGGGLDTRSQPVSGEQRPCSPTFQAKVLIENPHGILRPGLCGEARVSVKPSTLAERLRLMLAQLFHFSA